MTDPTTLAARLRESSPYSDDGTMNSNMRLIHEAAALIEQQQAIINRLPKTADGVPITPGMQLWGSLGWNNEPAKATLRGTYAEGYRVCAPEWGMNVRPEVECYSTQEAAEAARVGKE